MRRLPAALVRELNIEHHPESRALHVASGSGLVLVGRRLYVAVDDELHVGAFDVRSAEPGRLVRVFDGELPLEHRARKAAKPDVESVCRLDVADCAVLIGVPSGSTSHRTRGFALQLDARGAPRGRAGEVDWQAMQGALAAVDIDGATLNVEGSTVQGGELLLFLRGVAGGVNRIARLDARRVGTDVTAGSISAEALVSTVRLDIGSLDGIALGFTDAEALDDGRIVVTAAAEDTVDAYEDGAIAGSVVLLLDPDLSIVDTWRLDATIGKVEGVAIEASGADGIMLLLVIDDDDAARPSRLYRATLRP